MQALTLEVCCAAGQLLRPQCSLGTQPMSVWGAAVVQWYGLLVSGMTPQMW